MSCLPWISTINNSPWLSQQQVYPRVVSVMRSQSVAGASGSDLIGNVGYSGAEQVPASLGIEGEVILFTGLPASIQLGAAGRTNKGTELPGDAVSRPVWNIFIPAIAIAEFSVRDRDIVKDDEGYRYQVAANYWTGLGYQLSTIRQEA